MKEVERILPHLSYLSKGGFARTTGEFVEIQSDCLGCTLPKVI